MRRLMAVLVAAALCVIFAGCPKSSSQNPLPEYNAGMDSEQPRDNVGAVERVEVLPNCGHMFILDLKDGERIKGVLKVETGKDAHERVVKLINESVRPDVVLYEHREEEKVWEVDLLLHIPECTDGGGCTLKELSLTKWLIEEGLAWRI